MSLYGLHENERGTNGFPDFFDFFEVFDLSDFKLISGIRNRFVPP